MSITMHARCDEPRCHSVQPFSMESPQETGQDILDALQNGGWGVDGTFTERPKTVRLKCPHCMKREHAV